LKEIALKTLDELPERLHPELVAPFTKDGVNIITPFALLTNIW
jgi:hypothetical protein